jgi:hypothetical protein
MAFEDTLLTCSIFFAGVYAATLSFTVWSQLIDKRVRNCGWHRLQCPQVAGAAIRTGCDSRSKQRTHIKIEDRL